MMAANPIDTARIEMLFTELHLPAVKQIWALLATHAEGCPVTRFLGALAEHERTECALRHSGRDLAEARLPPGKTLDNFDFGMSQ